MLLAVVDSLISIANSYGTAIVSISAIFVSIIALLYTAKTYWLKSGVNIRGSYVTSSSRSCEDIYVSSVALENLKDRAVVIFKIYMKFGNNVFIEIDDFANNPLILKPFEVFKGEYDPIDLYGGGLKRVIINDLFEDRSLKPKLILSTSDGKYTVKSFIKHWSAIIDTFDNRFAAIVRPIRSTYKGKSYGSNAKFIVEFKMDNGREEVVPIYPRDYEIRMFKNFMLTQESLDSKEALEEFLYDNVSKGKLICVDIAVYDLDSWRNEAYERVYKEVIKISSCGWFKYYIIGKIYTIFKNYLLKRENKALQKKRATNQIKPAQ